LIKLGICASGTQLPLLAGSGAYYVEEHLQNFLLPELAEEAFEAKLRALPASPPVLAANCFLPGDLKCVGPVVDSKRLLNYGRTAFTRAKRAGIRTIVFGSSGARSIPEGFGRNQAKEQFVGLLKSLAPLAGDQGLTLVVEPLNSGECNFINSLDEGAELVAACGQSSVRLLCDIYHMRKEDEGADAIKRNWLLLAHVHVAEKEGRAFPGKHSEDFGPYLKALKGAGYQGAISLECNWSSLEEEAPGALKGFRAQLEMTGF